MTRRNGSLWHSRASTLPKHENPETSAFSQTSLRLRVFPRIWELRACRKFGSVSATCLDSPFPDIPPSRPRGCMWLLVRLRLHRQAEVQVVLPPEDGQLQAEGQAHVDDAPLPAARRLVDELAVAVVVDDGQVLGAQLTRSEPLREPLCCWGPPTGQLRWAPAGGKTYEVAQQRREVGAEGPSKCRSETGGSDSDESWHCRGGAPPLHRRLHWHPTRSVLG